MDSADFTVLLKLSQDGKRESQSFCRSCRQHHAADSDRLCPQEERPERLEALDVRKAKVIELKYFAGLEREEIVAALGLTLATVKRDLSMGEA